jgi:hypothetical protein
VEGSRFVGWQVYRYAAGGSRELPSVFPLVQRLGNKIRIEGVRETIDRGKSRAVPGSRLLPTYRPGNLQSGSPPGPGVRVQITIRYLFSSLGLASRLPNLAHR